MGYFPSCGAGFSVFTLHNIQLLELLCPNPEKLPETKLFSGSACILTLSFETQVNNIEVCSTQGYVHPSYLKFIFLCDRFILMGMFREAFFLG